jgi:hypothetical protein
MLRILLLAGLIALPLTASAQTATNKQKAETCKFGADHQKLTGAKRKAFMTKCMSSKDDPRGSAYQEKR